MAKLEGGYEDDSIRELINYVSTSAEMYCDRVFVSTVYTDERHDGDGTDTVLLNQQPIISVASFKTTKEGSVLTEEDDYVVYLAQGKIRLLAGVFPCVPLGIHVTYTAGFATIPNDIKFSVAMAVASDMKRRDNKAWLVATQGLGSEDSIDYITARYGREVLDVWDRYARMR